jgi:SAM-dependent methyltransferase
MVVHRDDERRGPATSFALVADAYERGRPGYPDEAVRWLVRENPCDVVDLGAGTGKLTRSLVQLGHRVTAIEPLTAMLEQLVAQAPGAFMQLGNAEVIPLPDDYADVITVAQAFHWFDHALALPEIARVLRSRGRLALIWNTRDDREPWVKELSSTIGVEVVSRDDAVVPIDASGLFGPVELTTFPWVQRLDAAILRDLVLSRSYVAVKSPEEREKILAGVDRLFAENATEGEIELPYVTQCYRAALLA